SLAQLDGERAAETICRESGEREAQAGEAVAGQERDGRVAEFLGPSVAVPKTIKMIERHDPAAGAFGGLGLGERERVVGGEPEAGEKRFDEARGIGVGVRSRLV